MPTALIILYTLVCIGEMMTSTGNEIVSRTLKLSEIMGEKGDEISVYKSRDRRPDASLEKAMSLTIVYSLGAYDHEIEEGIPTLALAQALVTTLQPYHDKPLQIKEDKQVRKARLQVTHDLLFDLCMYTP